MTILVTGAVGFIGYALVRRILDETQNATIVGVDNFSNYYDVSLKEWRGAEIEKIAEKSSCEWRLADTHLMMGLEE